MSDWTGGYVADIDYTYGYYLELNPQRARWAFLNAGLACPEFGTACELGFGQGLSANIHAAASVTEWCGTDFNPAQAAYAQEAARVSGVNARLYDEAFDEFARRTDLPDFDYIGLHGIWSWISAENRAVIVDFVRRKLKVGGVLFVSYNTLPGWSLFAPVRHLMTEHARTMGNTAQGILKRIEGALDFSSNLLAVNPAFAVTNPNVAPRLQKVKELNKHYLAHEYFNRDWHPMYFSDMAAEMTKAKLTHACSAQLLDHVDLLNLSTEQQKLLQEISDPLFRESVRDFITNQQFRRDYWVKGARPLDRNAKDRLLADLQFMLITPRESAPKKITTALGELNLKDELYKPLLDVLSDYKPHSFGSLAQAVGAHDIRPVQLNQMLLVLSGAGTIATVQPESVIGKVRSSTARLNEYLMQKAISGDQIGFLASPLTGGGVSVPRFQQLFLMARAEGLRTTTEWANYAWKKLAGEGQVILKDGKGLQTPEDNIAELINQATTFEKKNLTLLTNLGVA
jgi:hypothetical protein